MKLFFFRAKGKESFDANLEKVLFVSCAIAFFLLVIFQTAMLSPSLQSFLGTQNALEGKALGVEEYLFEEGQITLQLVDAQCSYDLKLLVNGDQAGVFSDRNVTIAVRNGDVIEMEIGSTEETVEVMVVSKSDNITTRLEGKKYRAKPGITSFFKITMGINDTLR